jgi:hypothetical protein
MSSALRIFGRQISATTGNVTLHYSLFNEYQMIMINEEKFFIIVFVSKGLKSSFFGSLSNIN